MDSNGGHKFSENEQDEKKIEEFYEQRQEVINNAKEENINREIEKDNVIIKKDTQENNDVEKNTPKKKNELLKRFIWLSIILVILATLFTINGYFNAGSIDGSSTAAFALLIPFFFLPMILLYIWVFYFIVTIAKESVKWFFSKLIEK